MIAFIIILEYYIFLELKTSINNSAVMQLQHMQVLKSKSFYIF